MQRIEINMAVLAIDDLPVGHVSAVRRCCFQVELADAPTRVSLTPESIFTVDTGRVTLVCSASDVQRYSCQSHRT